MQGELVYIEMYTSDVHLCKAVINTSLLIRQSPLVSV